MKAVNLRKFLPVFIVMCVAFFAALPLFQPGFLPTHDGEYHLIRFHEFETMLKNGYWFPRWAPDLNSGYGIPFFNFYYPVVNYFGVAFHAVGYSLADSFKLTLATGYLMATLFCFLWLSKFFSKHAATAAAIIFAFVPYWFVEIYVRGEVVEIFAIAWMMLALASIERKKIIITALSIAGIVLSHNILALIFVPAIFVYTIILHPKYLWSIFWGLGLSSYFWIPALAEQKYVTGLNTVNFKDYFPDLYQLIIPSWGTGFSGSIDLGNEMSYQMGLIPLLVIIGGILLGLKDKSYLKKRLRLFIFAVIISVFLILKDSLPLWELIPLLRFVQYPWRFLAAIIPITSFFAAFLIYKINKLWFSCGMVILAVVLSYGYTRPAIYLPRTDAYYLTRPNFTDGTSSLGNGFSTIWTTWKQVRPTKRIEFINGAGQIDKIAEKPLEYNFSVNASASGMIRVNALYYPGWEVLIDGKNQLISYKDDGLINFPISTGAHKVKVVFAETPLRMLADTISILSLLSLFSWFILRKYLWKLR